VSNEPPIEVSPPTVPTTATSDHRIRPSRRYRSTPVIDVGMMEGRVEATASSGVAPMARIAGVDRVAPPTPNEEDRTPVRKPITVVRATRQGSGTRRG
jgi:hypothetical protein